MSEANKIIGWRQFVTPEKIKDLYNDGPLYLKDMNRLDAQWAIDKTYSWSEDMLNLEMFRVIVNEAVISCVSSFFAVFLVVLIITGSLWICSLVLACIILVDLFLVAIISIWNLTFNNILVIHLVAGVGLSVLYSL